MQEYKAIVAVIFSKDRAMQLDATLRSFQASCQDLARCRQVVLFACSHKRHQRQYETLKACFPGVQFICEQDFHSDLMKVLQDHSCVLFLVDDNLFVRAWRISEITELLTAHPDAIGFSLRLGRNTTFCFTLNSPQQLPEFEGLSQGILKFRWPQSEGEFGYPLEVSSSIYRVGDLLPMIEGAESIRNPNLLESFFNDSKSKHIDRKPFLLCFEQSVSFCNPVNVVQTEYVNRRGNQPDLTPTELMRRFDLGYRIDLTPFEGLIPSSCHQLLPITFLPPKDRGGLISARIHITSASPEPAETTTAQAAGGMGECIEASCQVDMDSLGGRDRDLVRHLLLLARDACCRESQDSWFYNLAQIIHEDRQLNFSEQALSALELERTQDELQQLYTRIADLDSAKAALKDQLDQRMHTADEQYQIVQELQRDLQQARNELDAIHDSRTYRLATLFRDAGRSKKLFALLPLHLIRFFLPLRLKQVLKNTALFKVEKTTGKESKRTTIRNPRWPESKPLVSVVILCFNHGQLLEEAIASVLAQTWQGFEIVVVDGGSDDPHTVAVLDGLKKPEILIMRQKNRNPAKARNAGIHKARGKYVCCLNAEVKLAPTYLEKCLFRLESEGLHICGSWQQGSGSSRLIQDPGPFNLDRLLCENCLSEASLFRKDLWESVGRYDETMVAGYEGWEFWIRMAGAGARASTIHEPLIWYHGCGRPPVDGTRQIHEQVAERIRRKHHHLLSNPEGVSRIDSQRDWVEIEGGLHNLVRADRPRAARPMNILLAMPYLGAGGVETLVSQICRYLSGRNISLTIVTTKSPDLEGADTTPLFEKATPEIYHLPRMLNESQWQSFIFYLLQSRPIDIVWEIGSTYLYSLMPGIKTYFPQIKIVDLLFNEIGHTFENRAFNYCIDLNVVESSMMKSWLVKNGEDEERIRIIPNGVNLDLHRPQPKPPLPFQSSSASFVVGYFGRFAHEKGVDIFVEIANRLRKNSRLLFLMAGVGPLEQDVRGRVKKYGLEHSVKFLGFIETSKFLACCDVVLIPSRVDGRPNVLLEALATGIPVMATRIGGIPDVLEDGRTGVLCDLPDAEEFSEELARLVSAPELLAEMKINARKKAVNDLGIEKTLTAFESLFRDLSSHRE